MNLTETICPHAEIWEPETGALRSLYWSFGCLNQICEVACEPAAIASFAFAGSQYTRATLWCTFHDCHDRLESASLDAPRLTDVTPNPTDADGYVRAFADTLLAGDGELTVQADQLLRHGKTTLWRIQGYVALPLRKVDGKVRRLAVDSGRIATEDTKGTVTLRGADAVAIWQHSFKPKRIRGMALDASRLAVMRARALVTYDVTSGRRETTHPLPAGPRQTPSAP